MNSFMTKSNEYGMQSDLLTPYDVIHSCILNLHFSSKQCMQNRKDLNNESKAIIKHKRFLSASCQGFYLEAFKGTSHSLPSVSLLTWVHCSFSTRPQ